MQKIRVKKLKEVAETIAINFSNPSREFNINKETFIVDNIQPLSESTGLVYLRKNTEKIGLAFCYWINANGGMWKYFFPTYDHCIGMERVKDFLFKVEEKNFNKN